MEGLEFEFVGVLVVVVSRLVVVVVMGLLLQPAGAFTLQPLYRVLGRYAPASPEMKSW